MWSDEHGMYLNVLFTGQQSARVSPFNFHPMLTGVASPAQAARMADEWLLNSTRFCLTKPSSSSSPASSGDVVPGDVRATGDQHPNTLPPMLPGQTDSLAPCKFGLPSISRDDAAYPGDYWRGRVWGPMNALVYFGLAHPKYARVPQVTAARTALAHASETLLLQEWRAHGHVHENYDAGTGVGDNVHNSNPFYTWGGLLGYISLKEQGHI
jgi:hypothetical protein